MTITSQGVYHSQMQPSGLTSLEEGLLDFEGKHTDMEQARKAVEVRRHFGGMGLVTYYQHLYRMLDLSTAKAYAPETVQRLRKRVADREARFGRLR